MSAIPTCRRRHSHLLVSSIPTYRDGIPVYLECCSHITMSDIQMGHECHSYLPRGPCPHTVSALPTYRDAIPGYRRTILVYRE